MIIQILGTLESLKWSVAISWVIYMLHQSLIMVVIVPVNEMQIAEISTEMENDVKFSNFPPFLLSIKNNNFLIVFGGEVFLWCYS